jgi:hypothetical protein
MNRPKKQTKTVKRGKSAQPHYTMESTAFLNGLFQEVHEQVHKYQALTRELLSLEARIELGEKTLCLHRDHFASTVERTECAVPNDWKTVLDKIRFVGVRLADACQVTLQEKKKVTPEQLLHDIDDGMFRFRTNSPLREIHAALLKQDWVEKIGPHYVWKGNPGKQMPLRMMRVVTTTAVIDQEPIKEDTASSADTSEKV